MARRGNAAVADQRPTTKRNNLQLVFAVCGVLTAAFLWSRSKSPFTTLGICPATAPNPQVKILSLDPFILHISDFVSASERKYLLALGTPLLSRSTHLDDSGSQTASEYRTSSTAFLPATDPCVTRLIQRSSEFQGYLSPSDINVQITAYQPGQQYKPHFDWFSPPPGDPPLSRNAISTFFAILHSTCSDCGTEFPFINRTERHLFDGRWCDVIDCEKDVLTTRNVEGGALFWVNLDAEGKGRMDALHAGLPAKGGEKIGLNVWTDLEVEEIWQRGLFGASLRPPVLMGEA